MVGSACQYDAALTGFLKVGKHFFTLFHHILAGNILFFPGQTCCFHNLCFGQLLKFLYKSFGNRLQISKGHERIAENGFSAADFFHVVLDVFGIGGNNRTVIVIVGILKFITLIEKSRVEDKVYLLVDQPADVTVSQLGGIAFRFTGNGFNAQLVDLPVGNRRYDDTVTQFGKEGKPERIVLVHVQYTGNTYGSAGCFICGKGLIAEDSL